MKLSRIALVFGAVILVVGITILYIHHEKREKFTTMAKDSTIRAILYSNANYQGTKKIIKSQADLDKLNRFDVRSVEVRTGFSLVLNYTCDKQKKIYDLEIKENQPSFKPCGTEGIRASKGTFTLKQRPMVHSKAFGAVGGMGGNPSDLMCADGSYVSEFYGRYGSLIDRLGVKCSNGRDLGARGGGGGAPFRSVSSDGFSGLNLRYGRYIDNIQFNRINQNAESVGGGGGRLTRMNCNSQDKVIGVKLRTGGLVDNLSVVCGRHE